MLCSVAHGRYGVRLFLCYKEIHVFGLCPHFPTQSSKTLDSSKSHRLGRSVFCSNEATLGGTPEGFRVGADHQKDEALIRSLELSAPAQPLGRGKDWRLN